MILFRYLAREVLSGTLAVSSILLIIILSGRLVKYLAQAASGEIAADVLFTIIAFRIPGILELVMPLGLFIAILLAYGRLYIDSEMAVLSACGISQQRLLGFTMVPTLIVAGVVGYLTLYVSPAGISATKQLIAEQRARNEFEHILPGKFFVNRSDTHATYADSLSEDKSVMRGVFMAEMGRDSSSDDLAVLVAEKGEQFFDQTTGLRYLKLTNGHRYQGRPGEADYQVVSFDEYQQVLPQVDVERNVEAEGKPTTDLMKSDNLKDQAALQWRMSLPVLVLVVAMIATPLSKTNPRQGRYLQMVPAILLYIIYLVSLNAARSAVEDGDLPLLPGLWVVHVVFLAIAIVINAWPSIRMRKPLKANPHIQESIADA